MAEVVVAGAFGTPERVDLEPVKRALQQAPDLLQHLAHLVIKGRFDDGQPASTDMQSTPGRIAPLDQIDALFVWLWRESEYWGVRDGFMSLEHMVRRGEDLQLLGPRGIVGTPQGGDVLRVWAQTLVTRILDAWPTIEHELGASKLWGQMEAQAWIENVDQNLMRPLAMWPLTQRAPVPAKPRQCPVCQASEVWVDLEEVTAVCRNCKKVVHAERWLSLSDIARVLDVEPRSVRRWVSSGLLTARQSGKGREAELGAAQEAKKLAEARMMLGILQQPLSAKNV